MNLRLQKQIAARLLDCGRSRVRLDPARIHDIGEAITSRDMRTLIKEGIVWAVPVKGTSSFRTNKIRTQKARGRRKGGGSRKGKRVASKQQWIKRIRTLRALLSLLRTEGRIDARTHRTLYRIAKSGFFRNKNHLMGYLEKNNMLREKRP